MAYSGRYQPRNPRKYKGDHTKIIFRSLWEMMFMQKLDRDPNVKFWNSEDVVIPYVSTAQNDKKRRYFMDFWVEYQNGEIYLFEVKPKSQCRLPRRKRKTKKFLEELQTFQINLDKWKAAKQYSAERGWKFKILNEDGLKQMGIRV